MKYLNCLKGSVLILILLSTCMLVAQEETEEPTKVSKKAQRMEGNKALTAKYEGIRDQMAVAYEAGELHRVIDILELECLTKAGVRKGQPEVKQEIKKISKGLRSEVFEFAALAYLALDQPEDAEYYVRKVFALNHAKDFSGYWLDIREAYSEVYYTAPRLSIGFGPAITSSSAQVTKAHSIFDTSSPTGFEQKTYEDGYSAFAVNLFFEVGLKKHLSLVAAPSYYGTGYRYKTEYNWTNVPVLFGVNATVTNKYTHTNSLTFLELPIMFRYKYLRPRSLAKNTAQRLKPYIQAGAFGGMLLGANRTTKEQVDDKLAGTSANQSENTLSFGADTLFQAYQWGLTGSIGAIYELDFLQVGVDLNYRQGMSQLITLANRYAVREISHGVYDVPDEVKLNSLGLTVYLMIPLTYKAYKN